jgi:NAD(P)H-flavin reductase
MSELTETRGHAPQQPAQAMLPRVFRVARRRQDTADTFTLWLDALDGQGLAFEGGQFTMLSAWGVGEVPISISGAADQAAVLQHTIRDVGGVTHALSKLGVGDEVGVRGPFGSSWQAQAGASGDVLVVAGGIGLAPLRPTICELIQHRSDFGKVAVLIGARTPDDLLYTDELDDWRTGGLQVLTTVDRGTHDWTGRVGLVTALLEPADVDPARTLALLCGPEVMMRHSAVALIDAGVPESRIRVSMERNMRCGVGLCGHCQYRDLFLCIDGPVVDYAQVAGLLRVREV